MTGKRFPWGLVLMAVCGNSVHAVTFNNVVSLADSLLDDLATDVCQAWLS